MRSTWHASNDNWGHYIVLFIVVEIVHTLFPRVSSWMLKLKISAKIGGKALIRRRVLNGKKKQ